MILVRALDALASQGAEAAAAGARFEITINLGADLDGKPVVERYSKSIEINADDVDPNEVDVGVIAAIAAKKRPGGGNDGHI